MQVREIMSQPVNVVHVTTTSRDAATRMRDLKIGALPVEEHGQLVGMVTDRDIVARAVAENRLPSNVAVSRIMSEGVYYCHDDDTLEEAARIMAEHQVRRLPVYDHEQRLVGIIAVADIARARVREVETEVIEGVSQPSDKPRR